MTKALVHRFHYGNSDWPAPFTPEAELVYETPRREREMIHLAREQIEAQNSAAKKIAKSNMLGSQIISDEIQQQTLILDRTINQIGARISDSISFAADQITDAIDLLGDRICLELTEIKWQLAQQNETLEKILEVLYESRNNEARQLVLQGLRHYVNDEFEGAEERFKLALSFDTTDYQVLMNLAFIEIHKENSTQALKLFKKALSLPENLDSPSKARTLWATARLYYAEQVFDKAFSLAEKASKHDNPNDPQVFYTLGVYAALAGKKSTALEKIKQSILIDYRYLTKCTVDPDLQTIKHDIFELLGSLCANSESKAKQKVAEIKKELSILEGNGPLSGNHNFIEETTSIINDAITGLRSPSYSFCLRCTEIMTNLKEVIEEIKKLFPLYSTVRKYQEAFDSKNKKYLSTEQKNKPEKALPLAVYTIMSFISYILPGFLGADAYASVAEGTGTGMFIVSTLIWPLIFIISFFGSLVGVDEQAAFFGGCLIGLVIVGVTWGVISLIGKQMEKNYYKKNAEISTAKHNSDEAQRKLSNIKNEIASKEKNIEEQLSTVRL